MGGQSTEHDVSINSGLNVLDALDPERFAAVPVYIDRSGVWWFGRRPARPGLETDTEERASTPGHRDEIDTDNTDVARGPDGALESLRRGHRYDVAFVAMHGPGGEDGTIQGMLTLAGLPYTGPGVLASALAMDKEKAKEIFASHGIPVPRHEVVGRAAYLAATPEQRSALAARATRAVGLPCVVKPVAGGSSFATSLARDPEAVEEAVRLALDDDDRAIVEEHVDGIEVTCGVLGGGPWEAARALPVTEIVPRSSDFFDYRAKYTASACDEITPARIPPEVASQVQRLAIAAHDALGCEGMSRTDLIVRDGQPLVLETNTIPGLTVTSLLPQGAAAVGIEFPSLLGLLIESAMLRRRSSPRTLA